MKTPALFALACVATFSLGLSFTAIGNDRETFDETKLVGKWRIVSARYSGQENAEVIGRVLVYAPDGTYKVLDENENVISRGKYFIESNDGRDLLKVTPDRIGDDSGRGKGDPEPRHKDATLFGGYQIRKGPEMRPQLVICINPRGTTDVPRKLETQRGDGRSLAIAEAMDDQ